MEPLRIGYIVNAKKMKGFLPELLAYACERGCTATAVSLEAPVESQGTFDIIVHKINQELIDEATDARARELVARLEDYVRRHPHVAVVDPLPGVRNVLDRVRLSELLNGVMRRLADEGLPFAPLPFVETREPMTEAELDRLVRAAGMHYPLIWKARVACSAADAHDMSVALSGRAARELWRGEGRRRPPGVLQQCVPHGAVLFKVYVAGRHVETLLRGSLRDLGEADLAGPPLLEFNSQRAPSDLFPPLEARPERPDPPPDAAIRRAAELTSEMLGLTLFGADVIRSRETGRCSIVDVNFFPDYKAFPARDERLLDHLRARAAAARPH